MRTKCETSLTNIVKNDTKTKSRSDYNIQGHNFCKNGFVCVY